jgi:alcohol dehydrogenase class IV
LVDPDLTHSMPVSITATTGLDALTQLIEVYVSNKANPFTDSLCREGLMRAGRSLRLAYEDGDNPAAREDMAIASLFSGLGLANAKLGAVHGFAGPLGGMLSAPHGAICARLLPYVIETNVSALLSRTPGSPILRRFDEVAQLLTGQTTAKANHGVKWVRDLCSVLTVPSLTEYGLTEREFPAAIAKAQRSSSMKGNPIELTDDELLAILKDACNHST